MRQLKACVYRRNTAPPRKATGPDIPDDPGIFAITIFLSSAFRMKPGGVQSRLKFHLGNLVPGSAINSLTSGWDRRTSALDLLWGLQAAEPITRDGGRIQRRTSSHTPSARPKTDRLAHLGPWVMTTEAAEFRNCFRISRTFPESTLDEENELGIFRMISQPNRLVAPTPVPSMPTHLISAQISKHHLLRTVPSSLYRAGPATYETSAPGGLNSSGAAE